MISLNEQEKEQFINTSKDYIITQIQESKQVIPQDPNIDSIVDVKHNLSLIHI